MENKADKLVYKIGSSENDVILKRFLKVNLKFSSRFIRGEALAGKIKINDKTVTLRHILKQGEVLEIELDKEESQDVDPEEMDIDVIYEDSDVIVVNKPSGIVVHPTRSYLHGTLANGLLYHFRQENEGCIVRLVSRLDMDTSGLILVAKNHFSHMALARDMKSVDFQKKYLAIVHGYLPKQADTIDLPIYRVGEGSIKRVIDERGQKSITNYKVIKKFKNASLVELSLETGRTHQIRVHLSYIGNPIFGDSLYGFEDDEKFITRQALHAYKLSFPHPRTGQKIELQSDLPDDIKELIKKLEDV